MQIASFELSKNKKVTLDFENCHFLIKTFSGGMPYIIYSYPIEKAVLAIEYYKKECTRRAFLEENKNTFILTH